MEAFCGRVIDVLMLSELAKRRQTITYFFRRKKPDYVERGFEHSKQDGTVSPQKHLDRYPRLLKLSSDVRANYMKGGIMSNERFLPNDKVEEIVTKDSVMIALLETTIDRKRHEDLTKWVLESGKRLFLILVLLTRDSGEHLSRLGDLKNDGLNDSALPLGFSEAEPYYGYSLAETEGAQRFNSFKNWEDNNVTLFKVYQWIFLAPVLGASTKFRHQLRSEQPLPLLSPAKQPAISSVLGEISCGEIHPAHIDSQCLSALRENNPGSQGIAVFIKMVQPSDNLHPFFDIHTGNFKAVHPIISSCKIKPIAAYEKNGADFVIFQWVGGGSSHN